LPIPKYLFKRGHIFYFKRKIPSDVVHGSADVTEQVWRSLGTCLLAKARVLLAVEVTEFDLKVAEFRRGAARDSAIAMGCREQAAPVPASPGIVSTLILGQAPGGRPESQIASRQG